jgi:hypothetical protein
MISEHLSTAPIPKAHPVLRGVNIALSPVTGGPLGRSPLGGRCVSLMRHPHWRLTASSVLGKGSPRIHTLPAWPLT